MSALTGLRRWLDGRHYSRHLSRHELEWAADQDEPDGDDWAGTLHGMNQELAAEFAAAVCAPGCQGEEHRTALVPLPVFGPGTAWGRRLEPGEIPPWEREQDEWRPIPASLPATKTASLAEPASMAATGVLADASPTAARGSALARRTKRRRPWSGLFGGPDPQNLPGPAGETPGQSQQGATSRAGEPVLTGEIVPAPAADRPVTINVSITVNIHATPQLKADLARIDADSLAVLARIDAEIAKERKVLSAWGGQLELTAGEAA